VQREPRKMCRTYGAWDSTALFRSPAGLG